MREQNPFHLTLKRLGYGAIALFFILAGIGAVLNDASLSEVMSVLGGLLAILVVVGIYFVFKDTEATKRWWMDFGERHPFLKRIGQRLYRFYKTTLPPIRVAFWLLPLALAAGVWWVIEYEDVQEYGRGNLSGISPDGEEILAGQGYGTLIVFIMAFVIAVLVSTIKYVLRRNKPLQVKNKSKARWLEPEEFEEGGKYYELRPDNPDHWSQWTWSQLKERMTKRKS
ncbi:MAG TPA: hypothetical protein QF850_03215 [Acidimicrobiales bacterium]|jgi:hypothetical protein|nr:hypothetical protein [Acidimicrobiales bacterium]